MMLCSKLDCQKVFNWVSLYRKSGRGILKRSEFSRGVTILAFFIVHPGGNPGANWWFIESTPMQMPPVESTPMQMPPESGGICGRLTQDLPLGYFQGGLQIGQPPAWQCVIQNSTPHPEVELRANLNSISHRCHLFEVAFVWELTQ